MAEKKTFSEEMLEAAQIIWPWIKDRPICGVKIKSKHLRGRTKLTLEVEVRR